MSYEGFQKDVISNGGYILSDGTGNLEHLLPKVYDLLVNYEITDTIADKIKSDILSVFEIKSESFSEEQSLFVEQYWGDAELKEDKYDDASWIWNQDVFDYFCELSPANFYFGSAVGDGACIGWFKEDICSCCGKEFCEDLDDDGYCSECRKETEENDE